MKRSLLFLLLMLVNYVISPTLVNGQKKDDVQRNAPAMKGCWNVNQNFKRYAKPKSLTQMKIASQLAKTPAKISVPDKKAYAYMLPTVEPTIGLSEFIMSDPNGVVIKYPVMFGEEPHISGGAYANGKYYCYFVELLGMGGTMPVSFGYIDIETGDITDIASFANQGVFLSDMTYDYSTQTMYTLVNDFDDDFLATINLGNGQITRLAKLNEKYWTLAATYDGILYAINDKGELVILNKQTGRSSVVGNTGIKPQLYQSMDFDHTDETLYWAATEAETYNGYFCIVNVNTGKATIIDHLGNDDQMVSLYIPFDLPNDDVPAAVREFQVKHGENGAQSAILSWINPQKTVGGQPTTLTQMEIYRDDILVHTIQPVTGETRTWEDTEVVTGNHVYRVIPYNSAGKGFAASSVVFVGHDVPDAVSDIVVTKVNASTAKLTWKAPTEGIFGGWIDTSTLKYKIIRYPDEKVLVEAQTATEFTDNSITELNRYSYLIETSTVDGQGEKAVSEQIVIGSTLNLPYSCTFKDDSETRVWTIIDHDKDGFTWSFNSGMDAMILGKHKTGAEIWGYGGQESADDWLISPELNLEKGKSYKIDFSIRSDETSLHKVKLTLGRGATVEAQTIDLGTYEISDAKGKTYTLSLPDNLDAGSYNVGFHILFDNPFAIIQINSIQVEEDVTGHVSGRISDVQTGAGLENAVITLNRNGDAVATSLSDANGDYKVQWLNAGDYELSVDKKGHEMVKKNVHIEALKTITQNVSLKALPQYTLTGTIVDASGSPVEGVEIEISGYDHFKVSTDTHGKFNIPSLYRSSDYYITAFKTLYLPYFSTLAVTENRDLGNIGLQVNAIPPSSATAEFTEETVDLNWNAPVENTTFRYDSGSPAQRLGLSDGTEYSIMGSVYRTPALLKSMSWLAGNETVNVYVMDLNEQGMPTSKVLFSAKNIMNTDSQWTSYTFPHPVNAPNGFMVAISYDKGSVGIACAESTDEYPFRENTNFYSENYRSGSYILLENIETENNFMIRAEGVPMYEPVNKAAVMGKASSNIAISYNIYRVKADDEANKANWKKVASGITGTSYADNTWSQATSGIYRYAISAAYNNQLESVPVFTDVVLKDMNTQVNIHVDFHDKVMPVGGMIMFESLDNPQWSDYVDLDANWDAEMTLVKGFYKVIIASIDEEYNLIFREIIDRVDFSKEKSYSVSYSIYPIGPTPFNVQIEASAENSCTISWNNETGLFDDFEGHEDFAVNSPGEIGWTYIDGDGVDTERIGGLGFPNAGSKMAYIVMSPAKIEMSDEGCESLNPYSGNKYLTSIITRGGNDDYIISPELKFNKEFVLSFYARSYVATYGLEEMKVGYSLTGNKKEDFIWLTKKPVNVGVEWDNYLYTIPAGAKYVTINCVSQERFFFMLDDIYIGYKDELESKKYDYNGLKYTLYLDGKKVGETNDITYTFDHLAEGNHELGVQSHFENGDSKIVTVEYNGDTGIDSLEGNNKLIVYPNPVTDYLYIKGDYTCLTVISSTGAVLATQENGNCIDMSIFGKGIYLIKIAYNGKVSYHKVMVR